MKNYSFFLLLFFLLSNCQGNPDGVYNDFDSFDFKNKVPDIEKVLEKQLLEGAIHFAHDAADLPKQDFEIQELQVLENVVEILLLESGFKFPSDDEFSDIIYNVFRRKLLKNSEKKYLFVHLMFPCSRTFDKSGIEGFYICKSKNIITNFFYLPELIDYQREFPEMFELEKKMSNYFFNKKLGLNVEIEKWGELSDLKTRVEFNSNLVIKRNQYIFNQNKSAFEWLKKHDQFFMENLVLKFGWEGDDDLLRWVIKRVNEEYFSGNYNSGSAYAKLIFNRVCTSGVNINKRVLELLGEDIETHEYALNQVIQSLNKGNDSDYLSFSEDAKIKGHVLDLLYRKLNSEGWGVSVSYFFDDAIYEKYNKEFTKNNYYGLNDLKEIWELIRQLY